MKFQDRWSRWHHKPTDKDELSSNNAWIYTAECRSVGLPSNPGDLLVCYNISQSDYGFHRSPNKPLPAISHDEVIGYSYCLGRPKDIERWQSQHWQICNLPNFEPKPYYKLNWYKIFVAYLNLYLDIKNGANPRHQVLKYPIVFPVAFKMGASKRYTIKALSRVEPNLWETFMFYVSTLYTIYFSKSNSSLRLCGFKLRMLREKLANSSMIYGLKAAYEKRHNLLAIAAKEYHTLHPIIEKIKIKSKAYKSKVVAI